MIEIIILTLVIMVFPMLGLIYYIWLQNKVIHVMQKRLDVHSDWLDSNSERISTAHSRCDVATARIDKLAENNKFGFAMNNN